MSLIGILHQKLNSLNKSYVELVGSDLLARIKNKEVIYKADAIDILGIYNEYRPSPACYRVKADVKYANGKLAMVYADVPITSLQEGG
jgi:hypothetical protein